MMRITPIGASAVVLTLVTSTLLLPSVRGGILSLVTRSPKPNGRDREQKPQTSSRTNDTATTTRAARTPQQKVEQKVESVFVSERGTKYHREECRTLRGQGRKITLVEARGTYDPCKLCDPPV